jgi:L-asparaginase
MNKNSLGKLVVLGTGGTIAGTAAQAGDNIGYTAAQVGVEQLLQAIPGFAQLLAGRTLVSEQVAQVDSKDMSFAVWQRLLARVRHHLSQADVSAVVITHGTDTLEETAFFLHAALPSELLADKPVVLACAMRPASALAPDGPQNLLDAAAVAFTPGACGVVVVCAGTLHAAVDVQKIHTYRVDAFNSGDAGPMGYIEEGSLRLVRNWNASSDKNDGLALDKLEAAAPWPRVEIVMNYSGADGALVDAVLAQPINSLAARPLRGLVVAATGNGTVHQDLEAALLRAQAAGVKVVLATRCTGGRVLPTPGMQFTDSAGLSPVKARVALMLSLLL